MQVARAQPSKNSFLPRVPRLEESKRRPPAWGRQDQVGRSRWRGPQETDRKQSSHPLRGGGRRSGGTGSGLRDADGGLRGFCSCAGTSGSASRTSSYSWSTSNSGSGALGFSLSGGFSLGGLTAAGGSFRKNGPARPVVWGFLLRNKEGLG